MSNEYPKQFFYGELEKIIPELSSEMSLWVLFEMFIET